MVANTACTGRGYIPRVIARFARFHAIMVKSTCKSARRLQGEIGRNNLRLVTITLSPPLVRSVGYIQRKLKRSKKMNILKKILKGLQVLLVVLGFVMMVSNIVDTSRLGLPPSVYDQQVFLAHLLNAVQVLVIFGAAIALDTLITKIKAGEA